MLEEKNKFNYSKKAIIFLLSGGEQSAGSHTGKIIKEIEGTIEDESDWNPLENLNKLDEEVISKVNLKMLKILSN